MAHIDWVSIRRKCFNYSVGLKDLRPGARDGLAEEFIVILEECFVLGVMMMVLYVSLGLAPGPRGWLSRTVCLRKPGLRMLENVVLMHHWNTAQYFPGGLGGRGQTRVKEARHSLFI